MHGLVNAPITDGSQGCCEDHETHTIKLASPDGDAETSRSDRRRRGATAGDRRDAIDDASSNIDDAMAGDPPAICNGDALNSKP
jgi:hypothetical protein